MEKGLKTLQATARAAQRRASASHSQALDERGIPDHNSDSAIGLGSEAEMEVDDEAVPGHAKSSSWHYPLSESQQQQQQRFRHQHLQLQPEHIRSRSLPQPLQLYQPPPPPLTTTRLRQTVGGGERTASPQAFTFRPEHPTASMSFERYSPDSAGRSGISIRSVLAPEDFRHV